jgi:hypothetical protein
MDLLVDGREVGNTNGAVKPSEICFLREEGDGDFARPAISTRRRNRDSINGGRLARSGFFEPGKSDDLLGSKVIPASNDLCGSWLSEDESLPSGTG